MNFLESSWTYSGYFGKTLKEYERILRALGTLFLEEFKTIFGYPNILFLETAERNLKPLGILFLEEFKGIKQTQFKK